MSYTEYLINQMEYSKAQLLMSSEMSYCSNKLLHMIIAGVSEPARDVVWEYYSDIVREITLNITTGAGVICQTEYRLYESEGRYYISRRFLPNDEDTVCCRVGTICGWSAATCGQGRRYSINGRS